MIEYQVTFPKVAVQGRLRALIQILTTPGFYRLIRTYMFVAEFTFSTFSYYH